MLNQVADGVWVRQSEWVWSNAIVVRGQGGYATAAAADTARDALERAQTMAGARPATVRAPGSPAEGLPQ